MVRGFSQRRAGHSCGGRRGALSEESRLIHWNLLQNSRQTSHFGCMWKYCTGLNPQQLLPLAGRSLFSQEMPVSAKLFTWPTKNVQRQTFLRIKRKRGKELHFWCHCISKLDPMKHLTYMSSLHSSMVEVVLESLESFILPPACLDFPRTLGSIRIVFN